MKWLLLRTDGRFRLKTGDVEYDYSLKGQLERLFQTAGR